MVRLIYSTIQKSISGYPVSRTFRRMSKTMLGFNSVNQEQKEKSAIGTGSPKLRKHSLL